MVMNVAPRKPIVGQTLRVYQALSAGAWLTLPELHRITGDPVASISAQIRHLRKPEFGGHTIDRRRRGIDARGLFEYRMQLDHANAL